MDLFDWTPPLITKPLAHKGVSTSEDAARSLGGSASAGMQRRIVAYLSSRGAAGATYDEVVVALDMEKPTVAGRLNDLYRGGFVRRGKDTRPTRSGRSAKINYLTERGHDLAAGIAREEGR